MNKIIVLQGPPACGKSTWTNEYMKSHKNNTVIVSRDSIRESAGEYWVPSREDYISDIENFQVTQGIKRGFDVIIDATNLNKAVVDKWNSYAAELNCEIEFKEFILPFNEALARDTKRGENGGRAVGKSVLKKFYYKYYPELMKAATTKTVNHPRIEINNNLPKAVICDLDGTIAWMQGRSPYDVTEVKNDRCDYRLAQLLNNLMQSGVIVLFVSGREGTEQCYNDTFEWLKENLDETIYHKPTMFSDGYMFSLKMRPAKDYRPDEIIKQEIYDNQIKGKYDIISVFDDRNKVVNMWRNNGLLVCQVNEGDF